MRFFKRTVLIPVVIALGIFLINAQTGNSYPARGGKPGFDCSMCHAEKSFAKKAVLKLIDKSTNKDAVDGNKIIIPIRQGDSRSYTFIVGSDGKTKTAPTTVGWMFVLPGGVQTELPNCIRLLNSKQPFSYKYKEGDVEKVDDNLTVATQTFFFDGNAGNFTSKMEGELRIALGERGKGKSALGTTVYKLIFVPEEK